ncbi:unnamed protein product [Lampetra fluviatilis]
MPRAPSAGGAKRAAAREPRCITADAGVSAFRARRRARTSGVDSAAFIIVVKRPRARFRPSTGAPGPHRVATWGWPPSPLPRRRAISGNRPRTRTLLEPFVTDAFAQSALGFPCVPGCASRKNWPPPRRRRRRTLKWPLPEALADPVLLPETPLMSADERKAKFEVAGQCAAACTTRTDRGQGAARRSEVIFLRFGAETPVTVGRQRRGPSRCHLAPPTPPALVPPLAAPEVHRIPQSLTTQIGIRDQCAHATCTDHRTRIPSVALAGAAATPLTDAARAILAARGRRAYDIDSTALRASRVRQLRVSGAAPRESRHRALSKVAAKMSTRFDLAATRSALRPPARPRVAQSEGRIKRAGSDNRDLGCACRGIGPGHSRGAWGDGRYARVFSSSARGAVIRGARPRGSWGSRRVTPGRMTPRRLRPYLPGWIVAADRRRSQRERSVVEVSASESHGNPRVGHLSWLCALKSCRVRGTGRIARGAPGIFANNPPPHPSVVGHGARRSSQIGGRVRARVVTTSAAGAPLGAERPRLQNPPPRPRLAPPTAASREHRPAGLSLSAAFYEGTISRPLLCAVIVTPRRTESRRAVGSRGVAGRDPEPLPGDSSTGGPAHSSLTHAARLPKKEDEEKRRFEQGEEGGGGGGFPARAAAAKGGATPLRGEEPRGRRAERRGERRQYADAGASCSTDWQLLSMLWERAGGSIDL